MKLLGIIPLLFGVAAEAQQVNPCFESEGIPYQTTAAVIAEPWGANTRTFADGDIRIAIMDTWEPALAAYYLMVLFWTGGEQGYRDCRLISQAELGFVSMMLTGMSADYDAARGLVLNVPTSFHNPATGNNEVGRLEVVINQQTAEVTAARR